jgi:AraC-like DNA-binding protein
MKPAQIYFDPSPSNPSGQVYVPAMGVHELMPPGLIRHGGKGSELGCLFMVFHGPVQVFAPYRREWLNAEGHFIAWDQDAEHHYGNNTSAWDHSWLYVSGRWIDQVLRNGLVPLGVPIDLGSDALPLRYLQLICDELRSNVRQDPDMLQGLLQVFWHDIERHFSADSAMRRPDSRLDHARKFIEGHFDRPFNLAETAKQAHLSPTHFCHRFARQFGVPPREYAMRLRMQRAAQLLANQELAVFQVAEMVGCPDALYFSRLFHKRYGLSPTQFRQQERLKSAPPPRLFSADPNPLIN